MRTMIRAAALAAALSWAAFVPGAHAGDAPKLKSSAVLIVDAETGEVLYYKNTPPVAPPAQPNPGPRGADRDHPRGPRQPPVGTDLHAAQPRRDPYPRRAAPARADGLREPRRRRPGTELSRRP